jgi:putative ABC transport system substrate-binding protein
MTVGSDQFQLKTRVNTMKSKAFLWLLITILLTTALPADAQQTARIPRIGYVSGSDRKTPGPLSEAFREGLRDLGYIEGKNILIEYRYIERKEDRVPTLVAELVQLKVDVILSSVSSAIRAAKQATKTIPIVMIMPSDPVATGLVESLARPGGNVTGLTLLTTDLSGKRLELLNEVVPGISRVGILLDASAPSVAIRFKEYEAAARSLGIALQSIEVPRQNQNPDLESAFQMLAKSRVNALITIWNPVLNTEAAKRIATLAVRYRLPSVYERGDLVEAGGFMSYAANTAESYKRAATYVDKILKGAKPADLPVEQPKKFEFVINLKTAKQIGLTIPPNVLARADRVIR